MLIKLFTTFFKIGLFSFGGGFAMIPLIQREVIERHKWISKRDFVDMLVLAQSTPGPIAVNTAVFVGYKTRGVGGAIMATLGTVLPSFMVILLLARKPTMPYGTVFYHIIKCLGIFTPTTANACTATV